MIPESEWEWFGQAGHFCCSDRWQYHLHTHIGTLCISTVGEFYRRPEDEEMTEIGLGRKYETFINQLGWDGEIVEYELKGWGANDRETSQRQHMDACELVAWGWRPN